MAKKSHMSIGFMGLIYLALMALLGLTIFAAGFPLGALGLLIALAIAAIKATLVILFFMHLKYQSKTVWIFAGSALVWLALLFSLTFADYLGRPTLSRSDSLTADRQVHQGAAQMPHSP